METFANMKCQLVKISWGIVEIGNTRVYAELWLTTGPMNLKIKFKVPNGMSYSYACSAKDAPFKDGQFLSYWIPKNVYFPVHFCGEDINSLVETAVKHLQLEFFEESRKWLTKEEDEAICLERKNCSLMDWLSPDHIRAKIQSLADVDDAILWRHVDGSDRWREWIKNPMYPENIRQRVLAAYGIYQVNISESVDGDITPRISERSNDGYVGKLVDATYLDGSDTTDWCVFVGTRSECEAYIRKTVKTTM